MNTNERLAQWCRHTRSPFGSAFFVALVIAALATAAACDGDNGGKATATTSPGGGASSTAHTAAVTAAGTTVPCAGAPTPTAAPTEAGDAWAQVAGALGDGNMVLRPPAQPLDMTVPRLTWVCSASSASQYTVFYGTLSESLVLCLDSCYGIDGNFPGPPTNVASASLRGSTASEMSAKNLGGTATSAFEISWREGGRLYVAKLTSAHLQMSDLEAVVKSLVPMS